MRKVLRSVHVQTSARFEIPRKNNRHKTGFFRKRDLSGQLSNVCHYSRGEGRDTFFFQSSSVFRVFQPARLEMLEKSVIPAKASNNKQFPSQLIGTPNILPASKIPMGNR